MSLENIQNENFVRQPWCWIKITQKYTTDNTDSSHEKNVLKRFSVEPYKCTNFELQLTRISQ